MNSINTFDLTISHKCDGGFPCKHLVTCEDKQSFLDAGQICLFVYNNTNQGNHPGIAVENAFYVASDVTYEELDSLRQKMIQRFYNFGVEPKHCDIYWEESKEDSVKGDLDAFSGQVCKETQSIETGFDNSSIESLFEDVFRYFTRLERVTQFCILPFSYAEEMSEKNVQKREQLSFSIIKRFEDDNDENLPRVPSCWIEYSMCAHNTQQANSTEKQDYFVSIQYE